jgi:putative DNA primase/helicase
MLVGPTRGGRGTIGRVLKGLVGAENYIGTSLRSLSEPFGMQSYIGKKVVVYTDARIEGLPMRSLSTIAERLLAITGEDGQHINRKNQKYFDGQLTARIVLFSNELPRFQDDSGALARRFLTWRMRESFLGGRADPELTPKLLSERAGILNLAFDALDRLGERGRLLQHASGEGMAVNLTDLASNVRAFVEECCAVGTDREILVDTLFNRFRGWCDLKGIKHAIGSNHFSTKIEAAVPTVTSSRPRRDNPRRLTMLFGIGLRKAGEGS